MSELPKIARERLQRFGSNAEGKPLPHPDADLLAGFVERSISAKEREQVTAHLSVCADCREVVAMSLPAVELGEVPQTTAGSGAKWPQWKLMRFGIGTATAAVITAALVFFKASEERKPQELAAVKSRSSESVKVQEPSKTDTAETRAANGAVSDGLKPAAVTAPQMEPSVRKPAEAKVAGMPAKDSKQIGAKEQHHEPSSILDKNAGLMRPAISSPVLATKMAPVPPPPAERNFAYNPSSGNGGNEITATAKRSAAGGLVGGMVATNGPAPAQAKGTGVRAMTASPDADQPSQASSTVQIQAAPVPQDSAADTVSAARGQAESASALKKAKAGTGPGRSGMTAEDAASLQAAEAWSAKSSSVTSAAPSANLFANPQPSYVWRIFDGKLQRAAISKQQQDWQDLTVAPGVKLEPQILSTSNTSVRVGSTEGTLYYSNDYGAQWHHVRSWTGQIVRLVFFRTELGVLETSTGEKWVTGDAGATWHKQP